MPEPSEPPEPGPPPKATPSTVAWGKVHGYADRIFDALEALEESGGILAAAEEAGWGPKARKRAEASLAAARDAIDRQLEQLRGGK